MIQSVTLLTCGHLHLLLGLGFLGSLYYLSLRVLFLAISLSCTEWKRLGFDCSYSLITTREVVRTHLTSMKKFINNKHSSGEYGDRERETGQEVKKEGANEKVLICWGKCFHIMKGGDLYVPHCEWEIMILPEFAWD